MKKVTLHFVRLFMVALIALTLFSHTPARAAAVPGVPTVDGTLWALGVNYAAHGWTSNFVNDFEDSGWSARFPAIKAELDAMAAKGVKVVRWWVFARMDTAPLWSGTAKGSTVTGLPTKWADHMKEAADYAYYSAGVRIYFTWTSFDMGKNDDGVHHQDIVDNQTVQNSFFSKAVLPVIQKLGSHPGVFGWDIINEPEWMIAAADGGDPQSNQEQIFSLAQMRSFVQAFRDYLKNNGAIQPVSVGSAGMKWTGGQYKFWSGLGLDFYDFHWYSWATQWFNPAIKPSSDLGLDKPVIIGEMMPNPGADPNLKDSSGTLLTTHRQVLEKIYTNGYAGYLPWAWTDPGWDVKPYLGTHLTDFMSVHWNEVNFGRAHTGKWALKGTLTNTASWKNTSQVRTVSSNTTYTAGVWMRGTGKFQLAIKNGNWGTDLKTVICQPTSSVLWTYCTTGAFSSGSNTQLTFALRDAYNTSSALFLDDAYLGATSNILSNPGFEGATGWTVDAGGQWVIMQVQ